MEIKATLTNQSGRTFDVVYRDMLGEADLGDRQADAVHAYCFCGGKLVLVYSEGKGYWTPPGGKVEEGEDVRTAIRREVKEETNMRVLKQQLIGWQDVVEPHGMASHVRAVCIVEPYGPFVADPDGEVTRVELVDPKDYKKYFDWGEIGDHLMRRALALKAQMDLEVGHVK